MTRRTRREPVRATLRLSVTYAETMGNSRSGLRIHTADHGWCTYAS